MKVITSLTEMQIISKNWEKQVSFIPTMGYLHEGHLSLVRYAQEKNDIIVVSIYVNPTQFSPDEDFSTYPREVERDIKLLEKLNVDYLFLPNDSEMYPAHYYTWVEVKTITNLLCGASRPTHFKGVTTVVLKLINLVKPTAVYLGEKDFQQLTVIKKMVSDLNISIQVVGCPIVRESDGIAMSSRNKYLSASARKQATSLFKSLLIVKKEVSDGVREIDKLKSKMKSLIEKNNGMIDYIEFIDPQTLKSITKIESNFRIVLAVFFDKTRLIDNMEILIGAS